MGPEKSRKKRVKLRPFVVPGNSYSLKAADLKASRKTRRKNNKTSQSKESELRLDVKFEL